MNTRSAHPSRLHPPLRGANGSLASVLATDELHMKNAQPRFRSCSDFCIFASIRPNCKRSTPSQSRMRCATTIPASVRVTK
jgi:hypothetical protein